MNDSDVRYTFACPSCSSSFSISLDRIPPVQARFSCPKCGKPMDFPSREEARVYMRLQASGDAGAVPPAQASAPQAPAPQAPAPQAPAPQAPAPQAPAPQAVAPQAPAPRPVAPQPVSAPPPASPDPPPDPPPTRRPAPPPSRPLESPAAPAASDKTYTVEGKAFERDVFDRRAMRNLIRTFAVNEKDLVSVGSAVPVRASEIPELKSLFELRKTARATPPPVCRSHTDVVAHYVCADSSRPLCEDCAPEKKFGGTSLRVCDHCGGTAKDLHEAPAEID